MAYDPYSHESQTIANSPNLNIIYGKFYSKENFLKFGWCGGPINICRERNTGRIVVVKQVPIKGANLKEGRIMKELWDNPNNRPFFVRLYNEFRNVKAQYLVMEYCSGGTLEELVEQNGGGLSEHRTHFAHLVEGVKKIHSHRYIHRDLNPSNILVTYLPNGMMQLKISDFGFAKSFDGHVQLKPMKPSPYRAPEFIEGDRYDKSIDVYSLGAIYFFMRYGKEPPIFPRFDKCGYPIIPNQTRTERHYMTENRMMCERTEERMTFLEDMNFRDGRFCVSRKWCACCGLPLFC